MKKEHKTILIQILLFIVTFVSTTLAGAEWAYSKSIYIYTKEGFEINTNFGWNDFRLGMNFSIPFLFILTVHEFGHYFMALRHRVKSSLPYYIPTLPIPYLIPSFGTMGAIIRLRERVKTNVQNFDIGLAGPLAGFVAAIIIIAYGFFTLPPAEHIFDFHPEYKKYGLNYADHVYTDAYLGKFKPNDVQFGDNLLFYFFKQIVPDPSRVPNPHELMHYPVLMAGFLALLFTSINLFPIGQLDGGHITYGLFGEKRHRIIATITFVVLVLYSGLGLVKPSDPGEVLQWSIPLTLLFYFFCFGALKMSLENTIMITLLVFAVQLLISWLFPNLVGYSGWIFFIFLIGRFVGIQHPPSEIEQPLDPTRVALGWLALLIFVISFTPVPITFG